MVKIRKLDSIEKGLDEVVKVPLHQKKYKKQLEKGFLH